MGPRIFGIRARDAGVVAVIRRGPAAWCHVSRWDPYHGEIVHGAWLKGRIYPQRCDVSPDGRWLVALVLKSGARWSVGDAYLAVSRLPWLTALAAWSTCGTWTRGLHFVDDRARNDSGDPDVGEVDPILRRYGLAGTRPLTFAVERRGGWREADGTPPRSRTDAWDEIRAPDVVMERSRPRGEGILRVSGRHAAFRTFGPAWGRPAYRLADGATERRLDDVQWADWAADGRLLVATTDGELQVRDDPFDAGAIAWRHDLAGLRPDPQPPPPEADRW